MLYTREERNIDETALNFIEESLDPEEFKGLFSNRTVKQILDLLVKHFAAAIRKRKIVQKDADELLYFACVNFQCDSREVESHIKQCIIDTITQELSASGSRLGGRRNQ